MATPLGELGLPRRRWNPKKPSRANDMDTADRREFLKRSGQGAAAAIALAASTVQARDSDQRFVVGVIGPGGMGSHHVDLLAQNKQVILAYVCDVDETRLAASAAKAEKLSGA